MAIKKKKIDFSLIIPCFNEARNIPNLIKRSKKLLRLKNFELILVNNGSKDNTISIFKKFEKIKNLKFINIKKNIGFGHGVMQGLKSSKGKFIGYTHADHQTDPMDFNKCIKKINTMSNKKIFLKGYRKNKLNCGWSLFDVFLTSSQTIVQSFLLGTFMHDIHSQPNVFSRSLLNYKKMYPKDFQIDTYFYYLAKKNNFEIIKFDVIFNKRFRGYGEGNNDSFLKKIKGIILHLIGSFYLMKILFF